MIYIEKKSVASLPSEIEGSIVDATNIDNKTINTYSARVIDELIGTSGEAEIIENANGTAIKYPDGRMECYHFLDLGTNLAVNKQYGGIYITQNTYSWTFPAEFIEAPTDVQVTGALSGGIGGATLSSIPSSTEISAIYIWHAQNYTFTGKTSGIYLNAKGRWK